MRSALLGGLPSRARCGAGCTDADDGLVARVGLSSVERRCRFSDLAKCRYVNSISGLSSLFSLELLTQVHWVPERHCWFLRLATVQPGPVPAHVRLEIGAVVIQAEVEAVLIVSGSR